MKNTTLCYIKQNDKYLMLHRTKKSDDPTVYDEKLVVEFKSGLTVEVEA